MFVAPADSQQVLGTQAALSDTCGPGSGNLKEGQLPLPLQSSTLHSGSLVCTCKLTALQAVLSAPNPVYRS